MKFNLKYGLAVFTCLLTLAVLLPSELAAQKKDTTLKFPFKDGEFGGLFLKDPKDIQEKVEYDPDTDTYTVSRKIGDRWYRYPRIMSFEEYLEYERKKSMNDYWKQKNEEASLEKGDGGGFAPSLKVNNKAFKSIFGGDRIDIRPQGTAELKFGVNVSRRDNPILPERQRRNATFDFDERIQLNVIGNIGEKLKLNMNYNTKATFDFENQTNLDYKGFEDEVIQEISAGNVQLPLKGSLITGSQTLFGIKTKLKFGRLEVTTVLSQEKGEKKEIEVTGGAQITKFEKAAAEYEANKHFFLAQYFRDNYESYLATAPLISSRVTITRVEVWKTNTNFNTLNTRNVLALQDLGEGDPNHIYNPAVTPTGKLVPNNESNNLYANMNGGYPGNFRTLADANINLTNNGFQIATDFEVVENAIMLDPSEYTVNTQLGYISLNTSLQNDQVLAVAFQFTLDGRTYQVGEFSTDGITAPEALHVKLLKGTNLNTQVPIWDLMMKNVYSLGAYNISQQDFILEIWYLNAETGYSIPFLPEGSVKNRPLINVVGLDRINQINSPGADGVFDYIQGVTINPQNGRIYFPVLEPFGGYLRGRFPASEAAIADKFAFDSLYTTTQTLAMQDATKNRFTIKGQYLSASTSDINLGAFNIPEGSVTVTAGGRQLTENADYTVDYNLGRVKIINDGILQSGQPIKISLQNNSLFAIQSKSLIGSRFDYKVDENLTFGGTILNLTERPLTRKINIGNEPVSNTIWGIDGTYTRDMPLVTRLVDKLPFYSTKQKSTLTVTGEFAHLIPGNSRAITKDGNAYIDDFEGSQSVIDIKAITKWVLASTPQNQPGLFPEGSLIDSVPFGYNRAKLAWYIIDPLFFRDDNRTPDHIKNDPDIKSNHYMREILETEVFPNRTPVNNIITNLPVLDLAYYPEERGPYNYDLQPSPVSAGVDPTTGNLLSPATRWGGIMRNIETTDFESSNIEFIQFWMMDPFDDQDGDPNHSGGDLYFNLGNISEDILRDGKKAFENGFPNNATDAQDLSGTNYTNWGRVPDLQSVVNAFDNDPATRPFQDVGLDGFRDTEEQAFFSNYLSSAQSYLSANAYSALSSDPSSDNYHYYRGSDYDNQALDILERYKKYNGLEGNSPTDEQSPEAYPTASTTLPNIEDINLNNNLDQNEQYYQYRVRMTPADVNPNNVGNNYITDVVSRDVTTPNGTKQVYWYQFKIPIRKPDNVFGNITDFKSIRFMRMFVHGWNKPVVLRFARLDLVRGEWRKYTGSLREPGEYFGDDEDETVFDVAAVNVEENSSKKPVNYVIPPGIQREIDPQNSFGTIRQLNEQALLLNVCNLQDGDMKAAFRALNLDIRQYKRLKMFTHVHAVEGTLNDGDVSFVLRLGTDFNDNYYEYEIPLKVTPAGNYNTDAENNPDQFTVWPEDNNLELVFDSLKSVKNRRNKAGVSIFKPWSSSDGTRTIRVKGNPNLAEVEVIMLGIKNPKAGTGSSSDDGLPKCAEMWVNEMRLGDFDNKGGWATTGRATLNVADLGVINLAGNYSTPGFGSIEKKVNERQQETRSQYDLSTNIDLGKLLPEEVRLSIPMYYGTSEQWIRPRWNPLDPDLEWKEAVDVHKGNPESRDSVVVRSENYTKRRSINFTNVRLQKGPKQTKSKIYDPQNISLTYAYSEVIQRDVNTERNSQRTYKGGLAYNYTSSAKPWTPFKKTKAFQKKGWKLMKDFNLYYLPKQISFQTQFDRLYSERQTRNNTGFDFKMPEFFQKSFFWNRVYSLRYDITKSLKFDFNATNNAVVEETQQQSGRVDKRDPNLWNQWKDTVSTSLREFGLNTNYRHGFNVNYSLPLKKIPMLNWITASAKYSGTYDWKRAPVGADSLGHTIQNSNGTSFTTQLNFTGLYNKVDYFKRVQSFRKPPKKKKNDPGKVIKKFKEDKNFQVMKGNNGFYIKSPNKNVKIPKNVKPKSLTLEDCKKRVKEAKEKDLYKDKKKTKKDRWRPQDDLTRLLLSAKNVSVNYSNNKGTLLPGYRYDTYLMGYEAGFNAPTFDFISGAQDRNYLPQFAGNNWLARNPTLVHNFSTTETENLTGRMNLKPFKDMRIDLNISKNYAQNYLQPFFFNDTTQMFDFSNAPALTGNSSVSFIGWNTAFINVDRGKDNTSPVFEQFLANRAIVSQRLGEKNGHSSGTTSGGYADGYGETHQDVLINSFLAGYSGQDAGSFRLSSIRSRLPMPNWRVTYNGLGKIKLLRKWFRSVTISHGYRGTYNVSSFVSNLAHNSDETGEFARDDNNNFIPAQQIATVSISEQFSPLVNVDMKWKKNNLSTKVEVRRDRNVALQLANNQVTLVKGEEYIIGFGYRLPKVKLPFKAGPNKRDIISDLDIRSDFSLRDNVTIIRLIDNNENQITAGQQVWSLKLTADYRISKALNIQAYFDRVLTKPKTSQSFTTGNTNAGISLRFTLSQ